MMRPRVVDTSVLVACADEADAHHAKARSMLAEPGPAVIPNEVFVETLGLLGHRRSRAHAKQFGQALREIEGIELGHETDLDQSLRLQDQFPKLSIVDCAAITLAWRLGADLDTFDEAQKAVFAQR